MQAQNTKLVTVKQQPHHRFWLWLGILVLIIVVVLVVLEASGKTHFFRSSSTISATHPKTTVSSAKNGGTSANPTTTASNAATTSTKNTAPVTSTGATAAPVTPSGRFVSNHEPNLGSQPAPSQESSVCVTSPGATCYIEFTNGNSVKKLDVQTADSNGAAYWTWDVNTSGFATGTWKVTAVASLNGNTATSDDPQALEVKP